MDVAEWKDASNVRLFRYDEMVLTRYEGKLRMVSLYRRPSTQTVTNALATSRNTAPVSLFSSKFLKILSTRRVSCRGEMNAGREDDIYPLGKTMSQDKLT
jgi:hypothetical protein